MAGKAAGESRRVVVCYAGALLVGKSRLAWMQAKGVIRKFVCGVIT